MYLFKLLAICLLYHTCRAKEEDILEFGDSDFDSRLAEHETALVMFYAPWCGHCKRLKPEYAKAAEDLIRNDPPVALVKVDCTEAGKETCNKNSVSGYPTLKIFEVVNFHKNIMVHEEAAGIVKYMKAQVGPSSKELKTAKCLEKFLDAEKESALVGFFEKESDLKAAFLKVANKLREKVRFAHTSYEELLTKQGINVKYEGKADSDDISKFITKSFHGLAGHRKPDNKQDFENPVVIAYYNVDYVKNPKGKVNFAVSSKDEFQNELNEYGLDYVKGDKPVVVARDAKGQKFILKDEFSVEALEVFVNDVLDGNLEPYLKSEPIPESQNEPVKVAVAKNFDEVVVNNGKDTLIEFYAPWCGHCKKLAPAYDELAEKLKNEDIAIVKMDATANDVPPTFDVRGFPTLYWAPRDSKDTPIRYEGGREADDFLKYIAKHATEELKGYDRKGNPKSEKTEL
ncbi:hypothetical protein NQ314_010828 [Rhamnusium bicolor]|uniref:Protein disulfide-isomerase n=1 Tax=Rhamnusium bicolor TaxID=1586634 RepID=A0AAV8XP20_9CUCU|nr:hypothetical protein NQ314_010828 [Rhamnusium bicolor]